jgi:hypothetical protein
MHLVTSGVPFYNLAHSPSSAAAFLVLILDFDEFFHPYQLSWDRHHFQTMSA